MLINKDYNQSKIKNFNSKAFLNYHKILMVLLTLTLTKIKYIKKVS